MSPAQVNWRAIANDIVSGAIPSPKDLYAPTQPYVAHGAHVIGPGLGGPRRLTQPTCALRLRLYRKDGHHDVADELQAAMRAAGMETA